MRFRIGCKMGNKDDELEVLAAQTFIRMGAMMSFIDVTRQDRVTHGEMTQDPTGPVVFEASLSCLAFVLELPVSHSHTYILNTNNEL